MEVHRVLRMTGGDGVTSYAINSTLQRTVTAKAKPFIRSAITELLSETLPPCLTIADLGCSSGPNPFLLASDIIDIVVALRSKNDFPSLEFQVYLNDLPGNDFNTLFSFIPYFQEQIKRKYRNDVAPSFVAGVPGTFYGRLFPANSLFFVHSCYSLHWLSQVPKGIEANKRNIYVAKTSPSSVLKAYLDQFETDFSLFLRSRSKEMILGGRMVLTVNARRSADPSSKECCRIWELLAKSLSDMVAQGLVDGEKVDTFNLPCYYPNGAEIRSIVEKEGSFHLDTLETFDINWDADDDPDNGDFTFDNITSAQNVANTMRAVAESMLVSHFGVDIIADLFHIFAKHVHKQLATDIIKHVNLVMCMTNKV